jgi:hypothetical protein
MVQETTEKIIQIQERLETTRSRQKSYADVFFEAGFEDVEAIAVPNKN